MNVSTAVIASALAISPAGAIPSGLMWGTALVWVTVALLLASLVGVLAEYDRPAAGERPEVPWNAGRLLHACTACAR